MFVDNSVVLAAGGVATLAFGAFAFSLWVEKNDSKETAEQAEEQQREAESRRQVQMRQLENVQWAATEAEIQEKAAKERQEAEELQQKLAAAQAQVAAE